MALLELMLGIEINSEINGNYEYNGSSWIWNENGNFDYDEVIRVNVDGLNKYLYSIELSAILSSKFIIFYKITLQSIMGLLIWNRVSNPNGSSWI